MASKPTIRNREEVENWIKAGKLANKENIYLIRPAEGKGGRSSPGQWIPISSARMIPSGKKYLLRRSQDNESLYVDLDEPAPGTELMAPDSGVQDGEIVAAQDKDIQNGIVTLSALDSAVETSAKAVRMANESMKALEEQRALVNAALEESAKAEMYRGFTLLAQRAFDLLSTRLRSPEDLEGRRDYERYLSVKSHLISQAGVDLAEVSAADLANLLDLAKDPAIKQLLQEIKQRKIRNMSTAGAEILAGSEP